MATHASAIAFINQKGGVGKTVSAEAILVDAAADKRRRVLGLDLDEHQRAFVKWGERRVRHGHLPAVEVHGGTVEAVKHDMRAYDFIVVDTQGGVSPQTLEVARLVDLVVVPTTTNLPELEPSALLVQQLWNAKIGRWKIAVAITRVDSETQLKDAKDYLRQKPLELEPLYPLWHRSVWKLMANDGRTLFETGNEAIDAEGRNYVRSIKRALTKARQISIAHGQSVTMRKGREIER